MLYSVAACAGEIPIPTSTATEASVASALVKKRTPCSFRASPIRVTRKDHAQRPIKIQYIGPNRDHRPQATDELVVRLAAPLAHGACLAVPVAGRQHGQEF